ncbi:MAG: hypothetical protein JNM84_07700 [Planctomycetes bacterium]|nr:hypothetical protein [Planctomycetota bacterium]
MKLPLLLALGWRTEPRCESFDFAIASVALREHREPWTTWPSCSDPSERCRA